MEFPMALTLVVTIALSITCCGSLPDDAKTAPTKIPAWPIHSYSKRGWPFEAVSFDHPLQSPVDVVRARAVNRRLPVFKVSSNHVNGVAAKIRNSGRTVQINLEEDPGLRPFISGGPLRNRFYLEQMHFHWGSEDIWGSEHFVDGESFAVEIHLVHFNSKYNNFEEAAKHNDGLAVLTVFAEASKEDNPLLKPLELALCHIAEANSSAVLDAAHALMWPASALTVNYQYYTYPGSLTTPPYSENVVFIIFTQPITLSHTQLKAFRSLQSAVEGSYITDNKRQLQPLHRRPIVRSTRIHHRVTRASLI